MRSNKGSKEEPLETTPSLPLEVHLCSLRAKPFQAPEEVVEQPFPPSNPRHSLPAAVKAAVGRASLAELLRFLRRLLE